MLQRGRKNLESVVAAFNGKLIESDDVISHLEDRIMSRQSVQERVSLVSKR